MSLSSAEETRYTTSAVNIFCKITYLFIKYYSYVARWYFREFDANLVPLIQAKCVMFGCTISVQPTPLPTFTAFYTIQAKCVIFGYTISVLSIPTSNLLCTLHNAGEVCYVWMHYQCTAYPHFQPALNSKH